MIRAFSMTFLLLGFASSSGFAQHTGPDYGKDVPSACTYDNGSHTSDKSRGGYTVTWSDRFNKQHSVTAPQKGSVSVLFPITGPSWIWYQQKKGDEKQRTGFNPVVVWVQAQFSREGDHVLIEANGYRLAGQQPDPGLWGEIKDKITDIGAIAAVGAKTATEAKTIAGAAGLLKK